MRPEPSGVVDDVQRYFDTLRASNRQQWALERIKLHCSGLITAFPRHLEKPDYQLDIQFVENGELRAYAKVDAMGDHVVFDEALALELFRLFDGLVEDGLVFAPEIQSDSVLFTGMRLSTPELASEVAIILTQMVATFIVAHELGHLVNGHLDLMRAAGGPHPVDRSIHVPPLTDLDLLTLEFDADAFAITRMFEMALGRDWPRAIEAAFRVMGNHPESEPLHVVYLYWQVWALVTGYWPFASSEAPVGVARGRRPWTRDRQNAVTMSTLHNARKWGVALDERQVGIIATAEAFAYSAYHRHRALSVSLEDFMQRQDDNGWHIESLANWARLRPLLDPLKRGGKLAPVNIGHR